MKTTKWMRRWIEEKIKYYESILQNNPNVDEKFRAELEEGIRILKELL